MSRKILLLAFWLALVGCDRGGGTSLRDGDIIFHTSRSSQSVAIQRATHSRYSHMGIIFIQDGAPYVFEAASTVQFTPVEEWIARGEGGKYVVKRLDNADDFLTVDAVEKMRHVAAQFQGKPYDLYFEWSDDRVYCSELVWKIYERAFGLELGRLQKLREFNLSDPLVRLKIEERYGRPYR